MIVNAGLVVCSDEPEILKNLRFLLNCLPKNKKLTIVLFQICLAGDVKGEFLKKLFCYLLYFFYFYFTDLPRII